MGPVVDDDEMMISPERRRREEADGRQGGKRGCEQRQRHSKKHRSLTSEQATLGARASKKNPITRPNRLVHDKPILPHAPPLCKVLVSVE
ncbi:hypothetical protein M431DRAFT_506316 [Trichoderma harzianum CBS 226.95]|uniref:Uncharacterized protein n=1 Tax=Trichoderma harzianum CBS 226.95 TaxID=983964 RepID=A0A2T4AI29_TRIHA|nr:hypothetical protein M431DRAFT_506316 [Trichoderma harzianum CBS 226.95]PTB56558.1 hypothetical protein M431DRAFT_506316 [Trichoderma harzianum CBS 226.95]